MKVVDFVFGLKPETLFVIIALFFGFISVFAVPQLSVSDEGAHFYRSYSVATGNFAGQTCSYPKEIINKVNQSGQRDYSFDISQENSQAQNGQSCGSAGSYYPFMHLPQSIGVLISKMVHDSPALMVLLGRISNLLFFVVSMYFIIKYVAVGKWVFFIIGLLPTTIHLASSLSYDTFNTVAIFAFVAAVLTFFGQKHGLTKKQLALLALLSLLVALAKTSNIILLLLIFVLPSRLFKQLPARYGPGINKLLVGGGVLFASLIAVFIWQKISGGLFTEATLGNRLTDDPLYITVILYNTYINPFLGYSDVFMRGVVGDFSSFQYHLPLALVIASYGLIVFSLLLKDGIEQKYLENRHGLLSATTLGVFVLSVLVITYGMYTMWASLPHRLGPNAIYADGVQGRYFTPLLALLIPVGIWLRKFVFIKTSSSKISVGIILLTSTSLLMFYAVETLLFIS